MCCNDDEGVIGIVGQPVVGSVCDWMIMMHFILDWDCEDARSHKAFEL